jgi:hypothetical protein
LEIVFDKEITFNAIGIVELAKGRNSPGDGKTRIESYTLQYWDGKEWKAINTPALTELVRIHRFKELRAEKVRLQVQGCKPGLAIAELMVYHEK